jgi:hypothetical protein
MELRLWKLAGVEAASHTWYREVDQGIGATLNFDAALDAFALTDRVTWATLKNKRNLEILTEGDRSVQSLRQHPGQSGQVARREIPPSRDLAAVAYMEGLSLREFHTVSPVKNSSFRRVHDCL